MNDFTAFAMNAGFDHSSLLKLKDSCYTLERAYRIDALSITRCHGSKDFLKGILQKEGIWFSFSKKEENTLPFYQMFSDFLTNIVNQIHCIRFSHQNENYILLVLEKSDFQISKTTLKDMDSIKKNLFCIEPKSESKNLNKDNNIYISEFTINTSSIIKNFFSNNTASIKNKNLSDISNILFIEIYEMLKNYFGNENEISASLDKKITTKIKSKNNFDTILFIETIKNILKYIIPSSYITDNTITKKI